MKYLLDVNALIAAIWKNHPDHPIIDAWLAGKELATCPISELGFLRISTNAKALHADMTTARQLLKSFLQKYRTSFIADDLMPLTSSPKKKRTSD